MPSIFCVFLAEPREVIVQLPKEQCPPIATIPDVTWPQAFLLCFLSVVVLVFVIWFFRWVESW